MKKRRELSMIRRKCAEPGCITIFSTTSDRILCRMHILKKLLEAATDNPVTPPPRKKSAPLEPRDNDPRVNLLIDAACDHFHITRTMLLRAYLRHNTDEFLARGVIILAMEKELKMSRQNIAKYLGLIYNTIANQFAIIGQRLQSEEDVQHAYAVVVKHLREAKIAPDKQPSVC